MEIPAGQASVTFTLTAVDDAIVDGDQTVTVSAAAAGFTGGSDDILITDDDVAAPVAIDVTNSATEAGGVNNLLTVVGGDGTTASGTSGTVFASHDGSVNVTHVTFNGTPFQTTNPGGAVIAGTSAANGTRIDGAYGTLFIGADGTYTYTLDATATDPLSSGDAITDVFTYTIASGGEVGPGSDIITGGFGQDGAGDRLNVDRSSSANLEAGTYNVNDFRVYVADHTLPGTITPILLSGTPGGPYTTLWVGSAFDPTSDGEQIVAANGSFTLAAATEVYSGFFTAGGSAAIIAFVGGSGSTDHDGSFVAPTAAGQTVTGISNPGLARTYAFGINYTTATGDRVGPGSDITGAVNQDTPGQDRLNVDRSRVLNLAAGTYNVDDFRLNVADHTQGGTITPMLLSGTPGGPYTTLWVGSAFDPTTNGEQFVPAGGSFTLAAATTVSSGFFTTGGGAAIIAFDADNSGSGSSQTAHDNSFTGPTAAGQTVTGFSNANLGRTYAFGITVSDSASPNKATVTITVNGANDVPIANPDTNEATEAASLNTIEEFVGGDGVTLSGTSGNVLGGTGATTGDVADTDVDGNDDPTAGDGSVVVAGITYTGGGTPLGANTGGVVVTGGTVVNGQYGTLTINPDGSYAYALDAAATNPLGAGDSVTDEFTYSISDTVIYADDFSGSGSLNGSSPDTAPGADTWTASSFWNADGTKTANNTASAWLPFSPEAGKVYTLSADVNPDFSSSTNWLSMGFGGNAPGDMDTAQFQGGGNGASPWMLFREADDSPSVIQTFGGPVANHDLTPDIVGSARLEIILNTTGANWTAEWKADGATLRNYTYTTNPTIESVGFGGFTSATGSLDNFSLVEGEVDPATLTITINGSNEGPGIAQTGPLAVTMSEDGTPTAFVAPTISATDVDGSDTLTWSIASGGDASNGTLSVSGTGASPTITYAPNADYNGSDSFTVQVSDGTIAETIVVNVTIDQIDDIGSFGGDISGSNPEDNDVTGTLSFTDTADGDTAPGFNVSVDPTNGSAGIDSSGNWTYTPTANFHGADAFTVSVTDDDGNTQTQVVSVTVTPVNDPGTFGGNTSGAADEGLPVTGTLTFTDTADGDATPGFTILTNGTNGSAAIDAGGNWAWTSTDPNFSGTDSFTVQVTDGDGNSETQVINVTANPVPGTGVLTLAETTIDPTVGVPEDLGITFTAGDPTDTDEIITVTITGIPVGTEIEFADPSLFTSVTQDSGAVASGDPSDGTPLVFTLDPSQFVTPTDLQASLVFNAPVSDLSLDVTWRAQDGAAIQNGTTTITANATNPPSSGGTAPVIQKPIVVVTPTATGIQAVAEELAPQQVDSAVLALSELVALFNSFQTTSSNFGLNQETGPSFGGAIVVDRIETIPSTSESGEQVDGLGLYLRRMDPRGNSTFVFAQFSPVERFFTFQDSNGFEFDVLREFRELLRPSRVGDELFESVFGPLSDEDETFGTPTGSGASETEEGEVVASREEEGSAQFASLLEAIQPVVEPSIFVGVEIGASPGESKPLVAGTGVPGSEFQILLIDSSGESLETSSIKIGEEGNWSMFLAALDWSEIETIEIEAENGETRLYSTAQQTLGDLLPSKEMTLSAGDIVGFQTDRLA